jgi:DNA-binding winged helix-turn-helix (wHTH) protein/tetratricopeptide (TPR) repeat protein/energy-coupling factor transporter ATP-binding protein EcfA2
MSQLEILEQKPFYLGSWLVHPAKNQLQNDKTSKTIQPKLMEVLTYLCFKQGKIINADELINQCWPNQYISDNPIHKCIAQLRKALGDSSKNPKYIATIPKRGYSIVANVSKIENKSSTLEPFWLNRSPFRGLKQYTSKQQEIFFGRGKAVKDILETINRLEKKSIKSIMILGQSGCGKSSLVQAGILPKLLNPYKPFKNKYVQGYTYIPTGSEQSPEESLLLFLYKNRILSHEVDLESYLQYINTDCNQLIDLVKPQIFENYNTSNDNEDNFQLIIFIDQLEHVFSHQTSKNAIEIFFKIIAAIKSSKKCLIFSAIRNEYYQELTESHSYIKIRSNVLHYDVPPLTYDEICDIVRKPAQAAGLMYETNKQNYISLDTYLINKAQAIKVSLPILQYTLSELYKNRKDNVLSYEVYKINGGMEGGLTTMAENTFLELNAEAQVKFEELLQNLIQINPESKKLATCKKVAIKQFYDSDVKNIIDIFTDKRLFQTERIDNESYLSITHDILISDWQRLRDWVKKNLFLLNSQHEVKVATNRWLHHNKSKDFLLTTEEPIKSANALNKNKNINLSQDEKSFIAVSNSKFSFSKNLRRVLVVALGVSLIGLIILAFSINTKSQQISETKNNAERLISFILFDLKDKLRPLGRTDLLDMVGTKTLEYFEEIGTDNLPRNSLLHWIEALHLIGDVNFNKGDYKLARENFSLSNEIVTKALEENENDTVLLEKHLLSNFWLGQIDYKNYDYQQANIYFGKYLELAQNLLKRQPDSQKWLLEVSYALNNLGSLSVDTHQLELAHRYFTDSIAIKEKLLQLHPNNEVFIADLADSISWLGKVNQYKGDLLGELDKNLESFEMSKELVIINPNNAKWRKRLSISSHRVALSYYNIGNLDKSELYFLDTITIMKSLVNKDESNFELKGYLVDLYLQMGKIKRQNRNFDKSLYYIQKSQELIDLFKINLKMTKRVARYNIQLIVEQAINMSELHQNTAAMSYLSKGLEIWNDYFTIEEPEGIFQLSLINTTKAEILQLISKSNENERIELLNLNILHLKPLIAKDPNNFRAIAIYLVSLKLLGLTEIESDLKERLKLSHYKNPDFNY